MKKYTSLFLVLGLFTAVTVFSAQAAEGARQGLRVCAATLAPSLLPFFVLSNLLSALGLPDLRAGIWPNCSVSRRPGYRRLCWACPEATRWERRRWRTCAGTAG